LGNAIRIPLAATTTFFVNGDGAATHPCGAFTCQPGSNGNTGLSASSPWQTIQFSVATMATAYDFAGQTVSLQVADGTYNECVLLPSYLVTAAVDKNIFILGNAGDVTKVVVNCASGNTFQSVNAPQGWVIKNVTAKASNYCLYADYHGSVYWDGGAFTACVAGDAQAVNGAAFVEFINHNYTTTGTKSCHVNAVNTGEIIWNAVTANVNGSTFTNALECSIKFGLIDDTTLTIAGSFTGPKYSITGPVFPFTSGGVASTQNSTQYIGLGSIVNSEVNYYVVQSAYTSLVNLVVNVVSAPAAGQTYTFTVRIGGADSALTCQIANPATTCMDNIHAGVGGGGSFTAGSLIDLKMVSSATSGGTQVSAAVVAHN
jgi:hypothetical protein